MNYATYIQYTQSLLSGPEYPPPYDNPAYLEYARLGLSRMTRWDKSMVLNNTLVDRIRTIDQPLTWIVIAEPWCGDAAPMLPFIARLANENHLIHFEIQLRDQPPYLIEQYLTNGGKSIPKLIVRVGGGNDLFTWGPRPASAQLMMQALHTGGKDKSTVGLELQAWYNTDKGQEMQREWLTLFSIPAFDPSAK